MKQGYRIISIEAADIYRQEQENGVSVGYKMPENKRDAYFCLLKIYLDNSLDSVELEKAHKRICRKKFSFQDKSENEYTLAVINLKVNYTYKPENGKPIKIKDLRSHFYKNGFYNSTSIPKIGYDYKKPFFVSRFSTRVAKFLGLHFCDLELKLNYFHQKS